MILCVLVTHQKELYFFHIHCRQSLRSIPLNHEIYADRCSSAVTTRSRLPAQYTPLRSHPMGRLVPNAPNAMVLIAQRLDASPVLAKQKARTALMKAIGLRLHVVSCALATAYHIWWLTTECTRLNMHRVSTASVMVVSFLCYEEFCSY
jgi:hypothetical protein